MQILSLSLWISSCRFSLWRHWGSIKQLELEGPHPIKRGRLLSLELSPTFYTRGIFWVLVWGKRWRNGTESVLLRGRESEELKATSWGGKTNGSLSKVARTWGLKPGRGVGLTPSTDPWGLYCQICVQKRLSSQVKETESQEKAITSVSAYGTLSPQGWGWEGPRADLGFSVGTPEDLHFESKPAVYRILQRLQIDLKST